MLALTRMREGCALIKTKQCINRSTEFEREFATAVSRDEYGMKRRKTRGGKAQAGPPEKKKKEAETGEKLFPRTLERSTCTCGSAQLVCYCHNKRSRLDS